MKRHLLSMLFLAIASSLYAGVEDPKIESISGTAFLLGQGNPSLPANLIDKGKPTAFNFNDPTWSKGFGIKALTNYVTLSSDINSQAAVNFDYELRVPVVITYYQNGNPSPIVLPEEILYINYHPDPNQQREYRQTDAFQFSDGCRVEVQVQSAGIVATRLSGAALSPQELLILAQAVSLQSEIHLERYYNFDPTQALCPADFGNSNALPTNELELRWSSIRGAEEYDLEWIFVDDYDGAGGYLSPSAIQYNFNQNAARVQIKDTVYRIPLVYEHGYLLYRVRGIGRNGNAQFQSPVFGRWSCGQAGCPSNCNDAAGTVDQYINNYQIGMAYEDDTKNWQAVSTFAEEGKRKTVVSHFDGTMRNRQSITGLSTERLTLVAETFYDYQGRAAVQALPAPVNDATLRYYANFNQNANGDPYSRLDFDITQTGCKTTAGPMRPDVSGASHYYSPFNPDKTTGFHAFIPDARRYPFTHTEYTPDNTGRVNRQGGVGPDHQMDSKHETRYFYSVPHQEELDQLFGNEAGDAIRYKKNTVVDANGQLSLSYLDAKGNTIATALAGLPPANVDTLPSYQTISFIVNLLAHNRKDSINYALVTEYTELVNTQSDYVFQYACQPEVLNYQLCDSTDICLDCIYDFQFKIIDNLNCGTVLFDTICTIGKIFDAQNQVSLDCNPPIPAQINLPSFKVNLPVGSYSFYKKLSVNQDAADAYVEAALDSCPSLLESLMAYQYSLMDTSGCNIDCEEATAEQSDSTYYNSLTPEQQQDLNDLIADLCDSLNLSSCQAAYQAMLADVSPGGQYGYIPPSGGPVDQLEWTVSVFNSNQPGGMTTILTGNYTMVTLLDDNGSPFTPATVQDIELNWRPEWADLLVQYHPEYCYYDFCIQHLEPSDRYNAQLMNAGTWQDAVDANYIVAGNAIAIMQNDPFFNPLNATFSTLLPGYNTQMNNNIVQYKNSGKSIMYLALEAANYPNPLPAQVVWSSFSMDVRDRAWAIYRSLYLTYKEELYYKIRTQYAISNKCYNECIGDDNFNPYLNNFSGFTFGPGNNFFFTTQQRNCDYYGYIHLRKKAKRFPSVYDILPKNFPYDFFNSDPLTVFNSLYNTGNQQKKELCCDSMGRDLTAFLQEIYFMAQNGQTQFTLNLAASNNFPDPVEAVILHGASQMTGNINVNQTTGQYLLSLNSDQFPCNRLQFTMPSKIVGAVTGFCCYEQIGTGSNWWGVKFRFKVLTSAGVDAWAEGAMHQNCQMWCPPEPLSCAETPEKDELLVLFNHLGYWKKFRAGNTPLVQPGIVGPNIRAAFGNQLGAISWNGPKSGGATYTAILKQGNKTCKFNFKEPSGLNWAQVTRIQALQPDQSQMDGQGRTRAFSLVLSLNNGLTQTMTGTSDCFILSDCCLPSEPDTVCRPCEPLMAQPRGAFTILGKIGPADCRPPCDTFPEMLWPVVNPCVQQQIDLAEHNAWQMYADSMKQLRALLRDAYMNRCLQAAEQFSMTYTDARHHFTLYYYDQANNLVETVPPAGVKPLNSAQIQQVVAHRSGAAVAPVYPAHSLVSRYRYNSLNQLIWQKIPDHSAEDLFFYDELGRLVASINARQRPAGQQTFARIFSYTKYDALGRIIEVGESRRTVAPNSPFSAFLSSLKAKAFDSKTWDVFVNAGTRTEITLTEYDRPNPANAALFPNGKQENLRGRVTAVTWQPKINPSVGTTSQAFYSYDIHGNVKTMVQKSFLLDPKTVEYDYDLVSGKINALAYQRGQKDQFHHRYNYDADNRLTEVRTSPDGVLWDRDAAYEYYAHGPLARVALGHDNVQGLDYAYTMHGWIKGMNSGSLDPQHDMGRDGQNYAQGYARDAVGYLIGFYNGDYKPIGQNVSFEPAYTGSNLDNASLYNGNIRHMVTAIEPFMAGKTPMGMSYRYDQLNRLKKASADNTNFANNQWTTGAPDQRWENSFTYDPNGNILTQQRNGHKTGNQLVMDSLRYHYYPNSNQLQRVTDPVPSSNYTQANDNTEDIDNQTAINNYTYDPIGNLTNDAAEKLSILWNLQGKVSRIIDNDAPAKTITFGYNPMGNRVLKTVNGESTYHVLDATGNVLATYRRNAANVTQESAWLYGSSRLGEYRTERCLIGCPRPFELPDHYVRLRGKRRYEQSNHLGNVLAVVSDRKLPVPAAANATTVDYFNADVITAQDYYAFGMLMAGRMVASDSSRYGFNGKENDNEIKGDGNFQDYGMRAYDGRLGRFFSVDPITRDYPELTPFQFASNTPIEAIDLDGLEKTLIVASNSRYEVINGELVIHKYPKFKRSDANSIDWERAKNAVEFYGLPADGAGFLYYNDNDGTTTLTYSYFQGKKQVHVKIDIKEIESIQAENSKKYLKFSEKLKEEVELIIPVVKTPKSRVVEQTIKKQARDKLKEIVTPPKNETESTSTPKDSAKQNK